jgi:hypothetical protein
MWDVYCHSWLPFGALLTDMEALGMAVDRPHLAAAQEQAQADQRQAQERFRWGLAPWAGCGRCMAPGQLSCWLRVSRSKWCSPAYRTQRTDGAAVAQAVGCLARA